MIQHKEDERYQHHPVVQRGERILCQVEQQLDMHQPPYPTSGNPYKGFDR